MMMIRRGLGESRFALQRHILSYTFPPFISEGLFCLLIVEDNGVDPQSRDARLVGKRPAANQRRFLDGFARSATFSYVHLFFGCCFLRADVSKRDVSAVTVML